jgi:hypothetical protein
VMQLLPVFGNHSRLAFEYVEKFSIHPMRIKVKKVLRLLTDIAGLFKTGKVVLNRCEYEVSQRGIVEALTIVNNKNFEQPLENHNYLKKVLVGIADNEREERRAALDKDLRVREERARDRTDRSDRTDLTAEERTLTAKEIRERAGKLVEQIGARS